MGQVFVVRFRIADGGVVDLLLFSSRAMADKYVLDHLTPAPLGVDAIEIVLRQVIGVFSG